MDSVREANASQGGALRVIDGEGAASARGGFHCGKRNLRRFEACMCLSVLSLVIGAFVWIATSFHEAVDYVAMKADTAKDSTVPDQEKLDNILESD
mmetsp:Transcript_12934/g.17415  ORF Transcript_12934/g.17415 Transcript_12934/m.17415 type:complete len:96 (+) Transcript_12934:23-310(+)